MKQLRLIVSMLMVASIAIFSGCGDNNDDDDTTSTAPTLTFVTGSGMVTGDQTVAEGDSVKCQIMVNQTGGPELLKFQISYAADGGDFNVLPDLTVDLEGTSFESPVYTLTKNASSTEEFQFTATNDAGESKSVYITLTLDGGSTGTVLTHTGVQIDAAPADGTNWENTCASIDGTTYAPNTVAASTDIQNKIDFVYHYNTETNIYSPAQFWVDQSAIAGNWDDWSVKNQTKLVANNSIDFATVTYEDLDALTVGTSEHISGIDINDVVAFETASGLKGVFKVTALEPGYNNGDYITIDIKVQSAQ